MVVPGRAKESVLLRSPLRLRVLVLALLAWACPAAVSACSSANGGVPLTKALYARGEAAYSQATCIPDRAFYQHTGRVDF